MVQTLIPFAARLAQAIGWSLVHSLWQGGIIYLLLLILFRAVPSMHARIRHLCSVMALLLLMLWTANTAFTQWQQLQTVAVHVVTSKQDLSSGYTLEVSPEAPAYSLNIARAIPHLVEAMPWITLLYAMGVLGMLLRLGLGLHHLHTLRRREVLVPDAALLRLLHGLQLRLGMVQDVTVRLSSRVVIPMVIGILRPMILLPITIADDLGPDGIEAILLHELAHISRADFLINFLQSLIETLLFFNPFAWRISATIRREREHCCDDLVVAHTSQPLTYARALVSLAARQQDVPSMALGATGSRPLLFNRIKRIVEMKKHPIRYGQFIAACSLAAILITVFIACFTPSFAQHSKKKGSSNSQNRELTSSSTVIVIDSNGVKHVYKSTADLPPETKAALDSGMRSLAQSQKELTSAQEEVEEVFGDAQAPEPPVPPVAPGSIEAVEAPEAPELPQVPDVDSIVKIAFAASSEAISQIDWNALRAQLDSANIHINIPAVDWSHFNRDLNRSIRRSLNNQHRLVYNYRLAPTVRMAQDPRLSIEIRKEIAAARREAERSTSEASREVERARRRVERARLEMEQAREELERLKGR